MHKSSRWDLVVGVLSQAILVGSGLIMLPFVVARLSPSEVAVWYIYLTIQAMISMLDFGLADTLTRFFSYAYSGASTISEDGVPELSKDGSLSGSLIRELLRSARRIYVCVSLIAGLLMAGLGTMYIRSMTSSSPLSISIWPSWIIFVLTMAAQTYFQWQSMPLIGSGRTRRNYEIAARSRGVQVVATLSALLIHPSLTSMTCSLAVAALVMRIDYRLALKPILTQLEALPSAGAVNVGLNRVLFASAGRLGGSVVGVLLTNRLVALAVAWFAGLATSAQYAIASQALVSLTSVAFVLQTMLEPRVASAGVTRNREQQKSLFSASLLFGWSVYVLGGAFLIFVVQFLLTSVGSKTTLPPRLVLFLMIVIYSLEMNMFACTRMITTSTNSVPYWRAMLITGGGVMVTVLAAGQNGLGLVGILVAQLLPQLAYNYWRWPNYCFSLIGLRLIDTPTYALRTATGFFSREPEPK